MPLKKIAIDSHAHCGIQDHSWDQSFEAYAAAAAGTWIQKVVLFPPVMEIYDRYDAGFEDTDQWRERRKRANEYLLAAGDETLCVIPYFFIWNDFRTDQLTPQHKGIKWHRHAGEPEYEYQSPRCHSAVAEIRKRNMPVVLEEEFKHTLFFINTLARGVRVIIPHMGGLNGGYPAIRESGLWENPDVYADTALASADEIQDYIDCFGTERILFGSDFPFGNPAWELEKIRRLCLTPQQEDALLHDNILRLLQNSNRDAASL